MAQGAIEIIHVTGTDMLVDALIMALGGLKLGEFAEEIGLRWMDWN